jgi:hypothetical protein
MLGGNADLRAARRAGATRKPLPPRLERVSFAGGLAVIDTPARYRGSRSAGRSSRGRGMADKQVEVASAGAARGETTASQLIDTKIAELDDWRGERLARIRHLVHEADPDVVEEVKWRKPSNPSGVPVWSHAGIVCTGETYKDKVKLTFVKGALLDDLSGLFNSSLDGNTRRAIDIGEHAEVDETAMKSLIRSAVKLNMTGR